jgi:peptidylprolyl isomerase
MVGDNANLRLNAARARRFARLLCGISWLTLGSASHAQTLQQVVDRAPAAAWRDIPQEDLVVFNLDAGERFVLQLAPQFAPVHVANIRALVRANWFDAARIVRVVNNYAVQWERTDHRSLPAELLTPPAEFETTLGLAHFRPLQYPDTYAPATGHLDGWPVATSERRMWLVHCYGMVGVAHENPPDNGNGAKLFAVMGQAPRYLDRNIALVGRITVGMDVLAQQPRGKGNKGFYENADEGLPITLYATRKFRFV